MAPRGPEAAAPQAFADAAGTAAPKAAGADHRQDAAPQVDGKPMWSASRRYSAEENAQRAFDKNGAAFGARDVDDFVRKAHAFVDHPPREALTLTRSNGDVLIYDPKANVFAVATKDGAPRTMFKPDDGMAYWQAQVDRDAARRQAQAAKAEG
ncbi:hypothetical protein [Phenylobacterium sp.]|uniref:hypothetical protein n=1 Tax=Phenylobacterium sp. TaxID=1871053 RepID=UPI0035B4A656